MRIFPISICTPRPVHRTHSALLRLFLRGKGQEGTKTFLVLGHPQRDTLSPGQFLPFPGSSSHQKSLFVEFHFLKRLFPLFLDCQEHRHRINSVVLQVRGRVSFTLLTGEDRLTLAHSCREQSITVGSHGSRTVRWLVNANTQLAFSRLDGPGSKDREWSFLSEGGSSTSVNAIQTCHHKHTQRFVTR